jgi:type 1 fimbria pilin
MRRRLADQRAAKRRCGRLILVACAGLLCFSHARADCSPTVKWGNITATFPAIINIPANSPVGAIVASVTVPIPGAVPNLVYGSCVTSGYIYWAIKGGPTAQNRIGTTSVPGIGYQSYLTGGGNPKMQMDYPLDASLAPGGLASPKFTATLSATVNLVVTGPVGAGPLALNPSGSYGIPDRVASYFVGNGGDGAALFVLVVTPNASSVAATACTVTNKSIAINLPKALSSALTTAGATTGSTPFTIDLNCPAGINMNVTLTDAANPSNRSTTLGIGTGSSASGVGLQILRGGVPVGFGADTSTAGNTNQWSAGVATGGPISIPLTVQYVRTSGTLVPGSVAAKATFTMSYQ